MGRSAENEGSIITPDVFFAKERESTQLSRHSGPELLTQDEIRTKPCLLIPEKFLWGIQPKNQYRKEDEASVKRAIEAYGEDFLREHPPVAFAVPGEKGLLIAIGDGHHRIRFSRNRFVWKKNEDGLRERVLIPAVNPVPCAVLTLEEALVAENRRRTKKPDAQPLQDLQELQRWISTSITSAQDSFAIVKPLNGTRESSVDYYGSKQLVNAHTVEELVSLFPSFTPSIHRT